MTVFWIVVALFLAGALLLLLPSLLQPRPLTVSTRATNIVLHRQQWHEVSADLAAGLIGSDEADNARADIERRVLEDARVDDRLPTTGLAAHRTAWLLALLIPLASVLTYLQLGRPEAVAPQLRASAPTSGSAPHGLTPEQIQQIAAALAERLKAQPTDADGWLMLGRSYSVLGRYGDAAGAWRKARALLPPNPTLLADLADVTGMAQGKRLAGEPARLVQAALDIDPRHVKALALAGSVAFEARDYGAARGYWERLVAVLPADSPMLRGVRGSIAQATQLESGGAVAQPGPAVPAAPADSQQAVQGEVFISPALAERVKAGDTLFIFARAAEGPRMPLAIRRVSLQDAAPVSFLLDDSHGMAAGPKLSAVPRVVIGARVSQSGNAAPQSGDLLGVSETVAPGARGVRVLIDRIQP